MSSNIKEEYGIAQIAISVKLQRLENALKEESKKFEKDPTNWGFVGNLNKVNSDLQELLDFLGCPETTKEGAEIE